MSKEIVAMISGMCRGANLQSQLEKPVLITVSIEKKGKTSIGCPYLQPLGLRRDESVIYFCEAGSPSLKQVLLDEAATPAERPLPEDVLDVIEQKLPRCYHKYCA